MNYSIIVPEKKRVGYDAVCPDGNIFRNCTKYTEVVENKTVYLTKNERIEKCCDGYEEIDGKCSAICKSGCENGVCVDPVNEICQCNNGFEADNNECVPILFLNRFKIILSGMNE